MSPVGPQPIQGNPGTAPGERRHRAARLSRSLVLALALLSLLLAWIYLSAISRTDPWYRNTDMNSHNMVDALAINSDISPKLFTQPGVPLKYLLALDYRVQHYLGLLPVWNMKKFGGSADPLREIPPLIRAGRIHSRILVMLFILAAAWLAYTVTREVESPCLAVIALCGSAGLLFHGLLTRPELLCVGLGNILALGCTWRATSGRHGWPKDAWLFLAGLLVGLAALEKLPGVFYLVLCYAWCWLSALIAEAGGSRPPPAANEPARFARGVLPAVAGLSALGLLYLLGNEHEVLGPVVVLRLRLAAVLIACLPLLVLWRPRHRFWMFLLVRSRELAVLGGGALAAFSLSYLLLRGVMSAPNSAHYLSTALHFIIHPAPFMKDLAPAENPGREFLISLKETPFLFGATTVLALGLALARPVCLRFRALCLLLLALALGLTYLMSRRHFSGQYSIFAQVPLLLIWVFGLFALRSWWQIKRPHPGVPWPALIATLAAFALVLGVYPRLQSKYYSFQDDAMLPVNQFTITFLYDHDDHMDAYLQIMKDRYGSRENFAATLEVYLADPAHRY